MLTDNRATTVSVLMLTIYVACLMLTATTDALSCLCDKSKCKKELECAGSLVMDACK